MIGALTHVWSIALSQNQDSFKIEFVIAVVDYTTHLMQQLHQNTGTMVFNGILVSLLCKNISLILKAWGFDGDIYYIKLVYN